MYYVTISTYRVFQIKYVLIVLNRAHGLNFFACACGTVSEITLVSATCNLSSLIDAVVLFLISSSSYYVHVL